MSDVPIKVSDLARECLAFELSTWEQFRGARSRPEQLLEIADRMLRRQDNTRERANVSDAWALASRLYRYMQPGMLAICDFAAQHALEESNYFLSTEVREKLVKKAFVDDSPMPARQLPRW